LKPSPIGSGVKDQQAVAAGKFLSLKNEEFFLFVIWTPSMLAKAGLRYKKIYIFFLYLRSRIDGEIPPMMYDVNHEEHKVSMIREKATDRAARQFFLLIRRKKRQGGYGSMLGSLFPLWGS